MSMFEIHGGFTGLAASSRVRLARNIKGYPFRLTEQQHSEIADKVFAALKENPTIGPEFDKKQIIPRSTEASQLVEEHLISPELAQNGGWLIVSKDSGVSIMASENLAFSSRVQNCISFRSSAPMFPASRAGLRFRPKNRAAWLKMALS